MAKLTWKTERRKIEDLTELEGNPRKASEKEWKDLEKSLDQFDLADPIIINQDNGIIGGHFRIRVLKEKGIKEIDVRVPDRLLTKKEVNELCLRLNRNTGSWDFDLLANFSEELLLDCGFDSDELDSIFGLDYTDDYDAQKELEKILKNGKRRTAMGDVWILGDHRLGIGSSTDREIWKKVMGDDKFDFLFTDPPYKLLYAKSQSSRVKTKDGWKLKHLRTYDSIGETAEKGKKKGFRAKQNRLYDGVEIEGGVPEFDDWFSIAHDYENPKGTNIMIFESWKNIRELWDAMEKYWKVRNMVIWHLPNRHQGVSKPGQLFSKYDIAMLGDIGEINLNEEYEEELKTYLQEKGQKLLDTYEIILYANKGKPEWGKIKGTKWGKIADHITWIAYSEASTGQNIMFGLKPLQILVPYLKILSPRDGIVMEPFGGSGSTLIASEIMKRKARVIELSPIYSEVILHRWEKFTGKQALKEK